MTAFHLGHLVVELKRRISLLPRTGNFAKACASNNFTARLRIRRGTPLGQTLSDRLLTTLGFVEQLVSARFVKVRMLQDRPALHLL